MNAPRIDVPHVPGAYRAAVSFGIIGGGAAAIAVGHATPQILLAVAVAAISSIAFGLITKVFAGSERFTFYHYQLLSLGLAAVALRLFDAPVLATLDVLAVGLAVTQTIGRLGCLFAGCCHGRPARHGIRYGDAHVGKGFPAHFAGVALVPVQALESLGILLLALWCALSPSLVRYLVVYALLRFTLELLRGDARPSYRGVSEAQWTAAIVAAGVAIVTREPLAIAAAAAITVGIAILIARHQPQTDAGGIARALFTLGRPHLSCVALTPDRLRISRGAEAGVAHYTISSATAPLDERAARRIARIVRNVAGHETAPHLVAAPAGIFHLLFAEEGR